MNASKRKSSIRTKILAILVVTILALIAVLYILSTNILSKSYLRIENEQTTENLSRASDNLQSIISQLSTKETDWAFWDDTYQFMQDHNQAYITSNLGNDALSLLKINAMVYIDTNDQVVFKKMIDLSTGLDVSPDDIASSSISDPKITTHSGLDTPVAGIIMLPEGPFLISSENILTSNVQGPSRGTLVFGKIFDQDVIQSIADVTHLMVNIYPYTSATLPTDVMNVKAQLLATSTAVVVPLSSNLIAAYQILSDLDGNPALIMRVETPRPVYNEGKNTFYVFMITTTILILIFGIILTILLDGFVISRFTRLSIRVGEIGKKQDFSLQVKEESKDEVGALASSINAMLGRIVSSQKAEKISKDKILDLLQDIKVEKEKVEQTVLERTKELQEEKARLLASINSLSLGFIIADLDNAVLLKNAAVGTILGISDGEISIDYISSLFKEDVRLKDIIDECMSGTYDKKICEIKEAILGTKFLRIMVAPVALGRVVGDFIGYVLLIEDITEAKVMERSREEFFAVASHELRTPLTAIRGNTEMILDMAAQKNLDPEFKEMLADIDTSSVRLIGIVNDFLEVSRLEQGKVQIKKEEFDLSEVAVKVVKDMQPMIGAKDVKLTYLKDDALFSKVFADKDKSEQVLLNLVGNSLKFTPHGAITVQMQKEGAYLKVIVSDSGIGISEKNQSRLFRKFQQAGEDMIARDVTQGTGLGLYISQLLVTAMGGVIKLEKSELGQGSTFVFTLPISR